MDWSKEKMNFLYCHIILAAFNVINSRLDAYRILKNKPIAHGINLGAYCVLIGVVCWLFKLPVGDIVLLIISGFCQRQFTFDIPLNLRRGLKWDYVSLAKPPRALMDRIEIALFGYNGRAPFVMYGVGIIICVVVKLVWL